MTNNDYVLLCDILKNMDENELNNTMRTIKNKLDAIHVVEKLNQTADKVLTNRGCYHETYTDLYSKDIFNAIICPISFDKRLFGFSSGGKIKNDISFITKYTKMVTLLDDKTLFMVKFQDEYEQDKKDNNKAHSYEISFLTFKADEPLQIKCKKTDPNCGYYLSTITDSKETFNIDIQSQEDYSKYDGKVLVDAIGTIDLYKLINSIKHMYSVHDENDKRR